MNENEYPRCPQIFTASTQEEAKRIFYNEMAEGDVINIINQGTYMKGASNEMITIDQETLTGTFIKYLNDFRCSYSPLGTRETYLRDNNLSKYTVAGDGNHTSMIIILNGCGASGKDTFEAEVKDVLPKELVIEHYSSIDPMREILAKMKTITPEAPEYNKEQIRKALSELKRIWDETYDGSFRYLVNEIDNHINTIMAPRTNTNIGSVIFVHIREPENIHKLVDYYRFNSRVVVLTTLVYGRTKPEDFDNDSDRQVTDYNYDLYINNSKDLLTLRSIAIAFAKVIANWFGLEETV